MSWTACTSESIARQVRLLAFTKMGSSRIYDRELPAILKPLRIGSLANCKHKTLVLTDYTFNG